MALTPQTPQPSWFEHIDLMQIVIAALLAYVAVTVRGLVYWFRTSITDLYQKYNKLNEDFNELKGEHKATHGKKS